MLRRYARCLPSSSSTSTPSIRLATQWSAKSRKTGRICGNCVLPRQAWRYETSMGKTFQRSLGKKFGFETGLEDRLLLLSLGERSRRLDDKKIKQLGSILQANIYEAVSANERLSSIGLQFSKVKVNQSFSEVSVYWLCTGEDDQLIKEILEVERHAVRRTLSEAVGSNCPEIKFIPDKSNLLIEEMDRLFKSADYGMDYRSVSHTARVLSNVEKKETPVKEPPKWKKDLLMKKSVETES